MERAALFGLSTQLVYANDSLSVRSTGEYNLNSSSPSKHAGTPLASAGTTVPEAFLSKQDKIYT